MIFVLLLPICEAAALMACRENTPVTFCVGQIAHFNRTSKQLLECRASMPRTAGRLTRAERVAFYNCWRASVLHLHALGDVPGVEQRHHLFDGLRHGA